MKFPWQQQKIIHRVSKTAKIVSRSKLRKKSSSKGKKLQFYLFQGFERSFLLTFSENLPAWLSKLQPTYLSKILRWNRLWKIAQCFNLPLCWRFKKRAFSQKDIFRVFTRGNRASRGKSWEKVISVSKIFILSGITFGDWAISLSFCIFLTSCGKTATYVRGEEKLGKPTLKNFYSINFGF